MKWSMPPLSRDKSDTLLLLLTCVLVLAPHAMRLPLWTSAFCVVLLTWRAWITFRGRRMPSRWVLIPVAAAAMAAGLITFKTFFGRDAGVTLLVLLLTLKLLEMRAKRDLFTVVFVSLFLILANFFYDQSIGMAAVMAVTVVAVLTTQLTFQYTGSMPPLKQRIGQGAMIAGLAVPVTLVLFLLFPRVQGPLWNLPNDAGAGRTGMSDSMSPGNISDLAGSDEVAFRVAFTDTLPAQRNLYWRGVVLGDFDGRTWRQRARLFRSRDVSVQYRGQPVRYQLTLEPSGRPWLYALDLPAGLPQVNRIQTAFTPELQIATLRPVTDRVRYDMRSYPDFQLQPNPADLVLTPWLALPDNFNPRTRAFGERLRSETPDDAALVNKVLQHFRREPFRYTLNPPLLGQHSVDEFLFSTRAGFCEHYASAFVVLMRAANIPARVVTGYQGGEINPVDGLLTVRQSDAHAWAEVWIEGAGWKRVDPTAAVAPERVEKNLASLISRPALAGLITIDLSQNSLFGRLRNNWEAVNNQWNQLVLNYSVDRQRDFIRALGFADAGWRTMVGLLFAAGTLAMAAVLIPLLWNRQKRDPVSAAYHTFCREMAKRGLVRAPSEGPRDFSQRLQADSVILTPNNKLAAKRFLALYEELQYARTDAAPGKQTLTRLTMLLSESR